MNIEKRIIEKVDTKGQREKSEELQKLIAAALSTENKMIFKLQRNDRLYRYLHCISSSSLSPSHSPSFSLFLSLPLSPSPSFSLYSPSSLSLSLTLSLAHSLFDISRLFADFKVPNQICMIFEKRLRKAHE